MTIPQWNILLNAIIAVGMVGYGVWLKYVIDQQLRSKDAANEALEAALKAKDAEIARLQEDTAPAIASAYAGMRQHANQVTEDLQKQSRELIDLTQRLRLHDKLGPALTLVGETNGIALAFKIVSRKFDPFLRPTPPVISLETVKGLLSGAVEALKDLNTESHRRSDAIKSLVENVEGEHSPS